MSFFRISKQSFLILAFLLSALLVHAQKSTQKQLEDKNIKISPKNLIISDSAFLILPIHQLIDEIREKNHGSQKIGTTGRGVGLSLIHI